MCRWSGASIVYWNCLSDPAFSLYEYKAARIKVEAAPTTLSWSIGNRGATDFGNGRAIWESPGRPVFPESLYIAQKVANVGCPAGSTGANVLGGCVCNSGCTGTIAANETSPYFTGGCECSDSGSNQDNQPGQPEDTNASYAADGPIATIALNDTHHLAWDGDIVEYINETHHIW